MSSDQMQDGMAEALRLTREGRLAEGTAIIQRTLGGTFAPAASPDGPGEADDLTETAHRVVNEATRPTAPSEPGPAEHTLRPAPRPPRRFRGMPRQPGGRPGTGAGVPTPPIV